MSPFSISIYLFVASYLFFSALYIFCFIYTAVTVMTISITRKSLLESQITRQIMIRRVIWHVDILKRKGMFHNVLFTLSVSLFKFFNT